MKTEWNHFWLAFIIIIGLILGPPLTVLYLGGGW